MKPQARKVLRHLKAAGAEGVHSRHLRADFIADPPTRVCELLRLGYDIDRTKEGNGCRYTLRAERGGASSGTTASPGPRVGSSMPLLPGGGGSTRQAPAATPLPGSVVQERKPTTKYHRYAHQPPDAREGWVLVLDWTDKAKPDFRWELRVDSQLEAAA